MPSRTLWIVVFGAVLACLADARAQEAAFQPLFDGATFTGWEGDRDLFRIEDEALVGGRLDERIPANAFLCTTRAYGDFELRLKARITGPGDNGGIQFRSRRVPDHHEVSGYQADMGTVPRAWFYQVIGKALEPDAPETASVWGALYDEARRDRYLAWSLPDDVVPVLNADGWNDLTVRAEGRRIQIWINGLQTVDYTESAHLPESGLICLQIHGGAPAEVWHKEIRLRPIR